MNSISSDEEVDFYVAEVYYGRAQKFRPLPDADPSQLAGIAKATRESGSRRSMRAWVLLARNDTLPFRKVCREVAGARRGCIQTY